MNEEMTGGELAHALQYRMAMLNTSGRRRVAQVLGYNAVAWARGEADSPEVDARAIVRFLNDEAARDAAEAAAFDKLVESMRNGTATCRKCGEPITIETHSAQVSNGEVNGVWDVYAIHGACDTIADGVPF